MMKSSAKTISLIYIIMRLYGKRLIVIKIIISGYISNQQFGSIVTIQLTPKGKEPAA